MNLLDLVLVLAIFIAVAGGYRLGLLARGASWLGLAVGVLLGLWLVPVVLGFFDGSEPVNRLFVGLIVLLVTISLFGGLGDMVGSRLRRSVSATSLRGPDRIGGAIAGVLGTLVLVWLLLPAAATVPGGVARQVRSSVIVSVIRNATPQPPDTVTALRGLVDQTRFPEVFDDLRPAPDTGPPPEQIPVPPEVVARVTASTVNVEAEGCGRLFEGSGWAVAENLIVTNAHVIAGSDTVNVRRPDGAVLPAQVVAFDPNRDLALLEVPDLGETPLPLAEAADGMPGATIGYPGGQDQPRTQPVLVQTRQNTFGRDIYGQQRTERALLFLAADLRQGDSGSPVIDAAGNVVGVVFAVSPDRPTTAFALDIPEVRAILEAPRQPGVGRCL